MSEIKGNGDSSPAVPQGILLTGEELASMHGERLQMLTEMAAGLGLSVTVLIDFESMTAVAEQRENEPEPVLANLEDS